MKKRVLIVAIAPVLLFFSLSFLYGGGEKGNRTVGRNEGDIAPDFSLYDTNGKPHKLKDVLGKKAVLLVFWATWCPYCVEEIPELNKIYQEYSQKGLEVLAVNIAEKSNKVSRFVVNRGINYTVLLDIDGKVADLYQVQGIPLNMILNKNGVILHKGVLPKNYGAIFKDLTDDLKKK
jgi:peroxiredoxin